MRQLPASTGVRLATNAETADQCAIPLDVAVLHVVEQPTPLANELHQSAPRVVITAVNLEVLGQVRDPVGQESDLHLGRARVGRVHSIVLDDLLLVSHNVVAL